VCDSDVYLQIDPCFAEPGLVMLTHLSAGGSQGETLRSLTSIAVDDELEMHMSNNSLFVRRAVSKLGINQSNEWECIQ